MRAWVIAMLSLAAVSGCTNPCASSEADLAHTSQDQASVVSVEDGDFMNVRGTLSEDAPEAWFSFSANAGVFQTIIPTAQVEQTGLQLCIYSVCNFNNTCPIGTDIVTAPNGYRGCCAATPVSIAFTCSNDSTTVWMNVTSPTAETGKACESYQLSYKW